MARNPSLLLVDANPDHRALLRQLVSGLPYAVAAEANYGVEAARLAGELQPEIVLVHIEEPLALAFRTLEVVQQAAPRAVPVVISRRNDGETARKAMLFGARGFVLSPPTANSIDEVLALAKARYDSTIQSALDGLQLDDDGAIRTSALAGGTVITVFGPKGGIGKTTLATNLAISIQRRTEARVAIVDVDADFGDVAVIMGIEPERTMRDLLDAYRDGELPPLQDFMALHSSGVHVLGTRHAERIGTMPDPDAIATLIRQLVRTYDFVIVDTPGAFVPQVAAALDEATTVLLVTSADLSSIKDARLAISMLRGSGYQGDRLKLVVNHATNANSVSDADVARTVGYDVFWTLPHDRAVPQSTQHGEPIVISNPRSRMAQRVDALATYLSGTGEVPEPEPRKRRFFW
ncbi:MAG: P-loop NTPase [Dehalococcoidia bacterium]